MALDFIGKLSLAAARDPLPSLCPIVLNAHGEAAIALAAAIDVSLNLNAQLTITPPTLALYLQALIDFEAQCTLALSLGLPTVSFDVTAAADLVVKLGLSLSLLLSLEALFALPVTVGALGYVGTGDLLGAAITLLPVTPTNALVIGAVDNPLTLPPAIASDQLALFLNGLAFPGAAVFTNLGDLTPVTLNACAQGKASIDYQLDLALKLAANIAINPPTFSASIEAMLKFAASLKAAAAFALPKVNFVLDASASIAASLMARFSLLYQLGLALNRQDAEFFVYTWDGLGLPLGAALTAELATDWGGDPNTPSSLPCYAAVFGTLDPVSQTAVSTLFGGAY